MNLPISDKNTSVICTQCCRLYRVSDSWKNENPDLSKADGVMLDHGICPDCLADSTPEKESPLGKWRELR